MNKLLEFFQDNGTMSSTRVMFVIGTFYAMAVGAWVFQITKDYTALCITVTTISSIFLGGKLIQKPMEKTP